MPYSQHIHFVFFNTKTNLRLIEIFFGLYLVQICKLFYVITAALLHSDYVCTGSTLAVEQQSMKRKNKKYMVIGLLRACVTNQQH